MNWVVRSDLLNESEKHMNLSDKGFVGRCANVYELVRQRLKVSPPASYANVLNQNARLESFFNVKSRSQGHLSSLKNHFCQLSLLSLLSPPLCLLPWRNDDFDRSRDSKPKHRIKNGGLAGCKLCTWGLATDDVQKGQRTKDLQHFGRWFIGPGSRSVTVWRREIMSLQSFRAAVGRRIYYGAYFDIQYDGFRRPCSQ